MDKLEWDGNHEGADMRTKLIYSKIPTHRLLLRILIKESVNPQGQIETISKWIEIPNDRPWNMGSVKNPTSWNGYKVLEFRLEPLEDDRMKINLNVNDIFKRFGLE